MGHTCPPLPALTPNLRSVKSQAPLNAGPVDASWFFWKEAYLDYGQLLTDGFYHVRKHFQQLPTLADLISDPQLAGGQVIMVLDREQDAPLVTLEVPRRALPTLAAATCPRHRQRSLWLMPPASAGPHSAGDLSTPAAAAQSCHADRRYIWTLMLLIATNKRTPVCCQHRARPPVEVSAIEHDCTPSPMNTIVALKNATRAPQALVREQLPRLRTEADRAALLANLICEAFGNYMGVVTEESALPPLAQLQVCRAAGPNALS